MNTETARKNLVRADGRKAGELRPVRIEPGYLKFPPGSVLISAGDTRVLCAASIQAEVPEFLVGKGSGWITAEYGMLPASTPTRKQREGGTKMDGRTMEIRRIIGRALRAAVDLKALGERTVWIDCDVIQADGGTRTLAVTGAWGALALAVDCLLRDKVLAASPIRNQLAAVSVGVVDGKCLLDLAYSEDSKAEVDMNVVMTRKGEFVEIQGTAESKPFGEARLRELLALARQGCRRLMKAQDAALQAARRKPG
jgi:ribonuclease PH